MPLPPILASALARLGAAPQVDASAIALKRVASIELDGSRIAYAVRQGRRKYQLVWCTIA
jgi:hypothetical protein